jgi:hypothetical protein
MEEETTLVKEFGDAAVDGCGDGGIGYRKSSHNHTCALACPGFRDEFTIKPEIRSHLEC